MKLAQKYVIKKMQTLGIGECLTWNNLACCCITHFDITNKISVFLVVFSYIPILMKPKSGKV